MPALITINDVRSDEAIECAINMCEFFLGSVWILVEKGKGVII
jgi:hypothetical protein